MARGAVSAPPPLHPAARGDPRERGGLGIVPEGPAAAPAPSAPVSRGGCRPAGTFPSRITAGSPRLGCKGAFWKGHVGGDGVGTGGHQSPVSYQNLENGEPSRKAVTPGTLLSVGGL